MYMVRNQIATMANCLGPFIFYNDMQIKYMILLVIIIIIIIIIIGKIRTAKGFYYRRYDAVTSQIHR
jgi:hypothetical protein